MNRFIFSLANGVSQGTELNLPATQDAIIRAFGKTEQDNVYTCELLPNISLDSMSQRFTSASAKEIQTFQFSGHGNVKHLFMMQQAAISNHRINSDGLANFLGLQASLKMVVFDSCNSIQLAKACIQAGIPAAIGTHQELSDPASQFFNEFFWRGIASGNTIQQAYDQFIALYQANDSRYLGPPIWELLGHSEALAHRWDFTSPSSKERESHNSVQINKAVDSQFFTNIRGDIHFKITKGKQDPANL